MPERVASCDLRHFRVPLSFPLFKISNDFFSDVSTAECSNGYERQTLVQWMVNLPQYNKNGDGTTMVDTELTLYWNEDTSTWGPPNNKHYWIHDVKWTGPNTQVALIPIEPNDDYNKRYATFNRNDLCNTDWPVSIGGTTLNCIIRSFLDTHLSATFGFGFDHIRVFHLV